MANKRTKTRRRASAESNVVITTNADGSREFIVDAKVAAELLPGIDHEAVEFKAAKPAVEADGRVHCGVCGKPAGTDSATGRVRIVWDRGAKGLECADCLNGAKPAPAKALANIDVHEVATNILETYKLIGDYIDAKTFGKLSDITKRKKPRVATNDDRNLSPSQHAAAYELGKRVLGRPATFGPAKKSAREAYEELRVLQESLTPKAQAKALDAMIDAKIATMHVPDTKTVVEAFFDDEVVRHGFTSFEAVEYAIHKHAQQSAPTAGSRKYRAG